MTMLGRTLTVAVAVALAQLAHAQLQGPSTGSTPYVLPVQPGTETISVLTVDNTGAFADDTVPHLGGGAAYGMAGIPDGMGAFDNNDGTFTLLVNHELANSAGVVRDHGGIGAFVSKWIINKNTLQVDGGEDLMKQVFGWNAATQQSNTTPGTFSFNRYCSADLPEVSAFYDSSSGFGTQERIFMHGEEGGAFGWERATVATGPDAGKSYILGKFNLSTNGSATSTLSPVQLNVTSASTASNSVTYSGGLLPQLAPGAQLLGQTVVSFTATTVTLSGNANADISVLTPTAFTLAGVGAWENTLANPFPQDKTIVIGNNDGGTGIMTNSVAVYVGTKQNSGSQVDKAGLTNGTLKFVNVAGNPVEIVNTTSRATNITNGTRFSLSATASTTFSRPEDGAWNPLNLKEYYFVTTDQLDQASDGLGAQIGRTRLWRLTFDDITDPDLGGKIDLLIDGQTVAGQKVNMFDNIAVNKRTGHIIIQEDVGGAAHNGKIWEYNSATFTGTTNSGRLTIIAKHDPARFGDRVGGVTTVATAPFTNDEESSGIIDITDIMASSVMHKGNPREAWYISSDQAHYTSGITAAQVEGGQIFVLHQIAPEMNAQVTRSGFVRDRRTGTYAQQLTIKNNNPGALSGPFYVVLDSLSPNATLANLSGTTGIYPPLNSPYIQVSDSTLAPGASASVTLQFTNPTNTAITYTDRVLNSIPTP